MNHNDVLKAAGLGEAEVTGGTLAVHSPIDGAEVAKVAETDPADMPAIIAKSQEAFRAWRRLPAPRRGELIRLLGEELRNAKEELGAVVTLEAGKIISEGLGEVQEMIDICDFAVGLSRQLYGRTIASERPERTSNTFQVLEVDSGSLASSTIRNSAVHASGVTV